MKKQLKKHMKQISNNPNFKDLYALVRGEVTIYAIGKKYNLSHQVVENRIYKLAIDELRKHENTTTRTTGAKK